jgi:hypothetical protein
MMKPLRPAQPAVAQSVATPGGITLQCPYCAEAVQVPETHLLEGEAMRCCRCGEQGVLSREWLGHTAGYRWELLENGDDDEP